MKKTVLLLSMVIVSAFIAMRAPESQTRTIINKCLKAIDAHKTCTYTMRSEERLVGKSGLRDGNIFTKINVTPRKIYMKMVTDPNKGTEILYLEGQNENKAIVNAGKMVPTLKLKTTNSLLTKDQHHTAVTSGFTMVSKIMGEAVKKADAQGKFDEVFKYVGDVTWNGRACYKVVIEDPTYAYVSYTAKKGENMYSVALKHLIPEYSMVETSGVKNFEEDLGGKTLKIPNNYAKKTVLFIDKENNFPIVQEMSDEKGVFERYSFSNLVVNPTFKADEFTEDFSEYGF